MKSFHQTNVRTIHSEPPESYDKKHVRLRFDLLDFDHALWGWEKLTSSDFVDVLRFLHSIEKQTWAELKVAAGGRSRGTNHHSLLVCNFDKKAQQRIRELNYHAIISDLLFSFRMNNGTRLYGLRDGEWFRMIWHDPYHTDPHRAAYPVGS